MKKLITILTFLISVNALAVECDSSVYIPLSTSQIMDNLDYYLGSECVAIQVRLQNNQFCTVYVNVRFIEDPISDAPEFRISRCEKNAPSLFKGTP
ncbi:MAG: hypothetical protein R2877_06790 [Bdellovibrionota bacterium]